MFTIVYKSIHENYDKFIFNITFIILNMIEITEKSKNSKNKREEKEKNRGEKSEEMS